MSPRSLGASALHWLLAPSVLLATAVAVEAVAHQAPSVAACSTAASGGGCVAAGLREAAWSAIRSDDAEDRQRSAAGVALLQGGAAAARRSLAGGGLAASSNGAAVSRPSVDLACGAVRGQWLRGGAVAGFRGIPYGKAPVGDLRFAPPEAAGCWAADTDLDASAGGPSCMSSPTISLGGPLETAEDCLNLNVFAPRMPAGGLPAPRSLPVVAYIHGGGLTSGCALGDYPLEALVERASSDGSPFILLAMNYRVGALGFAALPELAEGDERGISGNYGFLDQILALQWARSNIAAFGGDPAQVTLMGTSSGGTSIFALLAAPAARGLFKAALSLSGSPNITMDLPTKERQDRELWLPKTPCAAQAGPALAQCLRAADPYALQDALPASYMAYGFDAASPQAGERDIGWSALAFVDGVTVVVPAHEALAGGSAGNVSVLFQNEQCENPAPPVADADTFFRERLGGFATDEGSIDVLAAQYKELGSRYAAEGMQDQYAVAAFGADTGVTCGNVFLAHAAARGGSPGVFVATTVRGPANGKGGLPCIEAGDSLPEHMLDFDLVLGMADATLGGELWMPPLWCPYTPTADDRAFVEDVWGHWLSFIVTGKPRDSWPDVRHVSGGSLDPSANYSHALLGGGHGGSSAVVVDWKQLVCKKLKQDMGIGRSFWWIN